MSTPGSSLIKSSAPFIARGTAFKPFSTVARTELIAVLKDKDSKGSNDSKGSKSSIGLYWVMFVMIGQTGCDKGELSLSRCKDIEKKNTVQEQKKCKKIWKILTR